MRAANARAARARWTLTSNSAMPGSKAQGVEVTDPEGKRPLTLGEAASAQSFQLTEAGYYQLRLANGRQNEVGVNPDPKESNLDVIPDDVLALWQGKGGQSSQEASAPAARQRPTRRRRALWWYVMLLVLAVRRRRIGAGQPLPGDSARGIAALKLSASTLHELRCFNGRSCTQAAHDFR